MLGRKNAVWKNFLAIAIGILGMVKWSMSYGLLTDYLSTSDTAMITYYLIPVIISVMVFFISFDVLPIVAIFLIFFIYAALTGQFFGQTIYYNLISFLISTSIVWAFKRFLSF